MTKHVVSAYSHLSVRRLVILITILLISCAGLLAWLLSLSPEGEKARVQQCSPGIAGVSNAALHPGETITVTNGSGRCREGAYDIWLEIPGGRRYKLGHATVTGPWGTFTVHALVPSMVSPGPAFIAIDGSWACDGKASCAPYGVSVTIDR